MKIVKKTLVFLVCMVVLLAQSSVEVQADNNIAYSVGMDYGKKGKGEIDTTGDAWDAFGHYCDAGYTSGVEIEPTKEKLKKYVDGTPAMSSDILFFSGHGNSCGMSFGFWVTTRDLLNAGENDLDITDNLSHVKLVTFGGCKTAMGDANITKSAVAYGTETAVGWTVSVLEGSHSHWLCRYNNRLAEGDTVKEAVDFANSFIYLMLGSKL